MLDEISNNSGKSQSLWMETLLPSFPSIEKDLKADVCIVGAGIAGLSSAYTLAKQGKSVVVVDMGPVSGGQTARTTAHLTWALDERYYKLITLFGEENAKIAAMSHSAAIDTIEKIIQEENILCDFERVDGYLFVPPGESTEELDQELDAIKKIGKEVHKVDHLPFSAGAALRFPRQGQFHILKYLQGLINGILKNNGKIYNHTTAISFEDGSPCKVTTDSGFTITSKSVIVATSTPVNNRFYIHTKQAPYRTYVIAAAIPKNSVPKALYWDTLDPYHYIRLQKHEDPRFDWLIIGGEDHKTGQDKAEEAKSSLLENWARKRFPMIDQIEYRWSGQIFEPIDSLGFIGKNPGDQNIYIATGDSGNGMTNGTIAGILLTDLILGKPNPWENLYSPSRKTFQAASEFIEENLNTALQYADWLTAGDFDTLDVLPQEQGIILRKGLKKIAVYKDDQNKLHFLSAFCPHLGGCVRWNPLEKSWDCPCHGSRFDGCGKVMNGPVIDPLYENK